MDGIYLFDKPIGISSYDCIRKLKKALNFRKIGHSGTLDPFASGLLVVLVGKATKLANIFINDDKEYTGTIFFGTATDTYDKTGKVIETLETFNITSEKLKETFKKFQGEIMQLPPIYSALKHDGRKLYEYAREDEEIKINKRLIEIIKFEQTGELINNKLNFLAQVSKGTYIRSLAKDFGDKLNIPAHLDSLRRTKSGIFDVKDAYKIEDINPNLIPSLTIEDYAKTLEKVVVKPYLEIHVSNGIVLDERQSTVKDYISVYNLNDELLAIYRPVGDIYKPMIIMNEDN